MFATLPFNARHDQIKITFLRLRIEDRSGSRGSPSQRSPQHRRQFLFLLSVLGLFLAGLPHSCPCSWTSPACSLAVPDASLQFVQHPLSQSLPISLCLCLCLGLCCTLHNCRLLIDRSNNVMDAQPAFDATTPRGNPRCMLLYTYVRASSIGY